MDRFDELVEELKKIKDMGWVKTHRSGNTGIGKTLEDLLGITENNVPGPDTCGDIELKSARKTANSMLTLFTKSPDPSKANSKILKSYGYESSRGNGRLELHTTVNAVSFNNLKGKKGFKININEERERIELSSGDDTVCGYWSKAGLKNSFERKLPRLLYVKADSRKSGSEEEFYFEKAWLLSNFSFDNFVSLLERGTILVDIRIGQYPDGRTHDHGTAFRVQQGKLDLCFQNREKIV